MGGVPEEAFPDFSKQSSVLSIDRVELVPEYRIEMTL